MESKIVVITDLRSTEAREADAYLRNLGYDVRIVPEDVCLFDEEAVKAFAESVRDGLHAVIHPAPPIRPCGIDDVTEERWEQASNEGIFAAFTVTKVFREIMRERGHGSIIYLNSIHSEKPIGKGVLFSINAGATQMLMREACQDYGYFGLRFFFIQNGITEEEAAIAKNDNTAIYSSAELRYPNRAWPEKDALNGLIAFLLTDAAAPLNGATLPADGGQTQYYGHRFKTEGREYYEFHPRD